MTLTHTRSRGLPVWEALYFSAQINKIKMEVTVMPANVETMFYVREKPWHGLGTEVQEAPTSADALIYAGLDWEVVQKNVYTENGSLIPGYRVNLRSTDNAALGIVSDRYKVVQNEDAFQFTDDLLGAGVTYETAGALQGGRKVWMLARMPHRYIIAGDEIAPYLVVMNSHDGSSGIKVAMTPIRVVCQNTLNLALDSASVSGPPSTPRTSCSVSMRPRKPWGWPRSTWVSWGVALIACPRSGSPIRRSWSS